MHQETCSFYQFLLRKNPGLIISLAATVPDHCTLYFSAKNKKIILYEIRLLNIAKGCQYVLHI